MKKIIVKHRLKSRESLIQKLEELELKFGPVRYQHDRVYVPRNYKPDANYARMILRTEITDVEKTPRYRMILKRHIADSGMDVVNSVAIKEYTEAVHIVHQLGFTKKAEISRRREELKLAEGSRMYLDKVEGRVGFFVKIENEVADDEQLWGVREEVERTFGILGFEAEKAIKETYADYEAGD